MADSKRFNLNFSDARRIFDNALIFLAPALVVFFTTLQLGGTLEEAAVALKVWGLNTVVDIGRKWQASGGSK